MNEEKTATTYKEYKNGSEQVAGLGRLGCYKALDYLNKLLKKDIYYSEELEDSIVFIECYINRIEKENRKYKKVINKAVELLGNYKHYSTPDEEQNSDNEDLINKAFNILKEVEHD